MHLLLNENIPLSSALVLREAGHDVSAITERCPGIADAVVMQIAHDEQRIIVTFDRDYGELVFRRKLPLPAGVLYLRFSPRFPREPGEYIGRIIASGIGLEGRFTTGYRDQVRQRPLMLADDA